ncbi:stromal interaction molecule 2-like isoform X2 [Glandiceps talaboti]
MIYPVTEYWGLEMIYPVTEYWGLEMIYPVTEYWGLEMIYPVTEYWGLEMIYPFLRDELEYEDNFDRHNTFHGDDNFISVDDLWNTWRNSEVYNWTVDETIEWLIHSVDLPQYTETFQNNAVDGPMLPRLAVNNQFLTTILGIKDTVHKHKINLKATDAVLFGAPKPRHNYIKDTALVLSLVIAVGGCWFAYVQHKYSQSHMKQMMKDMESLHKAEESLQELQEKLQQAHQEQKNVVEEKKSLEEKMRDEIMAAKAEAERLHLVREDTHSELNRLRLAEEELDQVRSALRKAEKELECRSGEWFPPHTLQLWLQVTHEIELQYYNQKRQAAEQQLTAAKEGCEKLRKKRSAFMGSLRIAHSSSLDEVDHRILSAKSALAEVLSDLQERLHRWGQIEMLIEQPIVNNPGLSFLRQLVQGDSAAAAAASTPLSLTSSPSTPLIVGNLTPMDVNPHIALGDCDEDLPPTYSMVTGAGPIASSKSHSSTLGSIRRAQALRAVQSTSSLTNMTCLPSTSGVTSTHTQRQISEPSGICIRQRQQASTSKFVMGDSPISDVGAIAMPKETPANGHQLKTVQEDGQPESDKDDCNVTTVKGDKKAVPTVKGDKKPVPTVKGDKKPVPTVKDDKKPEQLRMTQSMDAISQTPKTAGNSVRLKTSLSTPDSTSSCSSSSAAVRPTTLAISHSESNLTSMVTKHSINNNSSTLPKQKKKTSWFKKHGSPPATVLDDSNEDSSDSFDSDEKKKKKKKLAFLKSSEKQKSS